MVFAAANFLSRSIILFAISLLLANIAAAQLPTLEAQIVVGESKTIDVTCQTNAVQKSWRFAGAVASVNNLDKRIENFETFDRVNQSFALIQNQTGEFVSANGANSFRYRVKLDLPAPAAAAAHVSWLREKNGVLMLNDLLPQISGDNNQFAAAKVTFVLPTNWRVASSESKIGENQFAVGDWEKAVFIVGEWRESLLDAENIGVAQTVDEWSFSAQEAAEMARAIFLEYKRIFGAAPNAGKISTLR